MGTLSDSLTNKSRDLLNSRLRSIPCFSSRPIRLPSNGAAFESLTGHEWRSLLAVMPAILVGFFADPVVDAAVTKTFASFARLVNLLCIPISSDSIINAAEAEITTFFSLVPEFYARLEVSMPQALTFHMIVHYPSSIRKFGTPMRTSTEVTVELPHKASVKAPAKRTSNRTVLEHGAFRYVVARDAIIRQFAFLATYHPTLMRGRSYSRDLDALIDKIDSIRDLGLPGVPLERVRPAEAGSETVMASDDDDDAARDPGDGEDGDEDEFDPWEGDFDALVERTKARMRAAKGAARSRPRDQSSGGRGDTDGDLGLAKDVRLKEVASADESGEVRVKERGAVSLRFVVPKYRRRRKGIDLCKLEEDFPIAEGSRDALARFVLTHIANPPLVNVNRQSIERVLPRIHSIMPSQLLELRRWSRLENTTMTEPIHGRLTSYHGSVRRDFAVVMRPGGKHAIFRPQVFLSFSYADAPPDFNRFHVAVGTMFSRCRSGSRDIIPKDPNSGLIVLAKGRKLEAVGIDSFIAPIHLVPHFANHVFDAEEDDEDVRDMSWVVRDCDEWLLNEFVDREVFHMVREPYWQFNLE